ncbi:glycosyltransferase [Hymenobacter sediminis]|uniref:glycosyltransferase n=1 Tax=Hymenobacter sediminis TaxID=2218621 RepID=UPI000DA6A47E|nr:glycosyltransferase [Hymenobacter sediminis]RPD47205.1 glycosyltransferase [Hymenobacter sediminis]
MKQAPPLRFHDALAETGGSISPWHLAPPPTASLRAIVIIPAKNEATSIPAALAALAAQVDMQGRLLPKGWFEVLVLANNCRDRTAQVARVCAAQHPQLVVHVAEVTLSATDAHVGKARRLLMDEACQRLERVGQMSAFIASTDADTRVAPTWLAAIAAELAQGADAVGGRILAYDADSRSPLRRHQLQDAAYYLLRARLEQLLDPIAHDPWPRHHQHFGASLALTAAAYRRVGGLPVVPYLEDEALYQALLRHDQRLRHSPAVRVFTSSRQQGRVPVGLSWQLRQWAAQHAAQQEPTVDNPVRLIAEWRLRAHLRRLWHCHTGERLLLNERIALPEPERVGTSCLQQELARYATFGQFWEKMRARFLYHALRRWPPVPVSVAIQQLRQELARHEQAIRPLITSPVAQCALI